MTGAGLASVPLIPCGFWCMVLRRAGLSAFWSAPPLAGRAWRVTGSIRCYVFWDRYRRRRCCRWRSFAPSSYAAAVFLIALATAFPVAVLTWSGVASVNKSYYDVARTLGASEWFLILRVAIPAALPQVFVGLFMGLGAAFSVLVTAEMMGVKAGLGWYLQWSQGWAAYSNMYAALIVMAILCSSLITLLFKVRDRALSWQKGTVKW